MICAQGVGWLEVQKIRRFPLQQSLSLNTADIGLL
jgi:hypothetical protein